MKIIYIIAVCFAVNSAIADPLPPKIANNLLENAYKLQAGFEACNNETEHLKLEYRLIKPSDMKAVNLAAKKLIAIAHSRGQYNENVAQIKAAEYYAQFQSLAQQYVLNYKNMSASKRQEYRFTCYLNKGFLDDILRRANEF